MELRVNLLACVTRHWLRDAEWLNLYGWWPADRKLLVAIFSCAGFDDMAAEGPETDRVIANAMVAALAGFFGHVGTHERPSSRCPLYYNEQRDWKHMSGAQAFDATCRRQLAPRLGKQLPALELLLKVFS